MIESIKNLSQRRRYQLAIITVGLLITAILGRQFLVDRRDHLRVTAVGDLIITWNGLPLEGPIFTVDDLKPGDCYTQTVDVDNGGQHDSLVKVRSDNEQDPDSLSTVLYIIISEAATDLYGGTAGEKTVKQFFTESNPDGIPLSVVPKQTSTSYDFEICMPEEVGNEFQKTTLIFDLVFIEARPPIEVPEVCRELYGIITNVVEGTEGDDDIHATTQPDLILAYGGNDRIDASNRDDCVIAGEGDDYIRSEDGNDIIDAGPGNDKIRAGSGHDKIYAGPGDDEIDCGSGDDLVYGGEGVDVIDCGSGDDTVFAEAGDDVIDGETDNDTIYGGSGNDEIDGGSGHDFLYGEANDDEIKGGSGNDLLDGGPGTDDLNGRSGTDTCLNGETTARCEL